MKKRISQKEWEYIGKYNPAAKWLRPLCSYSLIETEDGFRRECKIGWFVYLMIFVPAHLLQALCCMWDGGLKEFEICPRYLGHNEYRSYDPAYTQVQELWDKHK